MVAAGKRSLKAALGAGALAGVMLTSTATQDAAAVGESRVLHMVHSHTGENISIAFRSGGSYDSSALEKLNWFLRDWRTDEPTSMSPQLFDIVWHVYREVGAQSPIRIMSAYRSPHTNAMLRRRSSAVAKNSQHMRGNAMDIHIPGVSMAKVREIGMRLQRGGVGYYPSANSPFVHLDVGSVRHWPKVPREYLERLFPDGKTVHIPADGRPLANYEAALAEVQANGGSALDFATVSSGKSLWALLFGAGEDDEEANAAPVRGRGRAATRVADARGARGASAGGASAFANSDNPMNPGYIAPVEAPSRPVAVASLPAARVEPVMRPAPGLRDLDTKGQVPPVTETPRPAEAARGVARFEPAGNMPLPPSRPQGAAFANMVASVSPLPTPPQRPATLGAPAGAGAFALASAESRPAEPAQALSIAAAPLPPARPEALRGLNAPQLPGVIRNGEPKAPAPAYAAVSAPVPPQRQLAAASPRVTLVAPSAPATPAVPKVRPVAPALEPGRAQTRAAGERPLAVPAAVASNRNSTLTQGFAGQKYLPTLGFQGSFLREIDARGGFSRKAD